MRSARVAMVVRLAGMAGIAGLVVGGGCARPGVREDLTTDNDQPHDTRPPRRFVREGVAKFHMQRHFEDLQTVERWLVAGKIDDAKTLAFMLTRPATDPGFEAYTADYQRVADTATALIAAPDLDTALEREARVAEACAACHVRTAARPVFAPTPRLPPDRPTLPARMARHQWAADRLWHGMIAPDDAAWRAGLQVLAATPLAFPSGELAERADRLRHLARSGLAVRPDSVERRARLYGKLLVTCASCHAAQRAPARQATRLPP